MSEIAFRDIHKSFGSVGLFAGLSLTCPAHAYLCLLGPSGCGKTTLMRMVAGLVEPEAGDILIGGTRVNGLPPSARGIGLAFQNYALYPHLTVEGNLAFPLKAPARRGQYNDAKIRERVREVATLFQIDGLLHRSVNQLSGGQQQRVALGRSIICNPKVLLLDEPIAHLDARLRYEMRAELKQLHRRIGTTTIHVTHDQQEALAIADVIAVIKDGAVQQLGAPLELYNSPRTAFVASFVGDPPMSLLPATVVVEANRPGLRVAGVPLPLAGRLASIAAAAPAREVLLGLRPSNVVPAEPGDSQALAATIYSHESIGRQIELMLTIGDSRVRFRTDADRQVAVGDRFSVTLGLSDAALFDAASGRTLVAP
jgi:multiple sugar transport system ATP-binding protein